MASDEARKKWGTIFMGDREASVEQLNAMQEPMLREKRQKDNARDYMERVRAKAEDRAREILGAAYAERQKVLDEARAEIAVQKRMAAQECAKLKAEGETARQMAQAELGNAEAIKQDAEKIREAAHEEGFQHGMDDAARELQEFRGELGQSVGAVLRAVERQRKNILDSWRQDLVELTQCAVQAASGFVLREEHEAILKSLVSQSLDMLENRSIIRARVHPDDEATVSDMFRAARERVPELKQWIVTGDPGIEKGGLIAESGSGSVDLRRENFRAMVDGVLAHLALPGHYDEREAAEVRDIVEREVAHIASMTPEPDQPAAPEEPPVEEPDIGDVDAATPEITAEEGAAPPQEPLEAAVQAVAEAAVEPEPETIPEIFDDVPDTAKADSTNYEELEEELFPLEEEPQATAAQSNPAAKPAPKKAPPAVDPAALAEGGFL